MTRRGHRQVGVERVAGAGEGGIWSGMTTPADHRYTGYRYPAEVIATAVWLYFRFPLSLRMVEEMLAARGILISVYARTPIGNERQAQEWKRLVALLTPLAVHGLLKKLTTSCWNRQCPVCRCIMWPALGMTTYFFCGFGSCAKNGNRPSGSATSSYCP